MPKHGPGVLKSAIEQPRFHRFRLGDIECLALSDGGIPMPSPPGQDASSQGPGGSAPMLLPLSCLLARLPGGGVVLMDTGFGAGARPEDISAVLISHVHPDHVGGMYRSDGAQTYPNATYHIGAEELALWSREPLDLSQAASPPPSKARMAEAAKRMLGFAGNGLRTSRAGEQVLPGIGTMLVPGHSPGQVGFILQAVWTSCSTRATRSAGRRRRSGCRTCTIRWIWIPIWRSKHATRSLRCCPSRIGNPLRRISLGRAWDGCAAITALPFGSLRRKLSGGRLATGAAQGFGDDDMLVLCGDSRSRATRRVCVAPGSMTPPPPMAGGNSLPGGRPHRQVGSRPSYPFPLNAALDGLRRIAILLG